MAKNLARKHPLRSLQKTAPLFPRAVAFKLLGSSFFDYGLCVFFIVGGKLYYRQCISDIWYDAVEVLAVPAGLEQVRVAASRTWDYRLVVQMLTSDGTLYELYTQQAGLGKTGSEHISLLQACFPATHETSYSSCTTHMTQILRRS